MALVLIKDSYFGLDHRPKSTRDILRYRYWSYLHKVISRRLQILKSFVQRYFYFSNGFSLVLMTSARITQMFSTFFLDKNLFKLNLNSFKTEYKLSFHGAILCWW